jgi:putative acetyltransferase
MVIIRAEIQTDVDSVRVVNDAAFPTEVEGKLVDALRKSGKSVISLVAESEGRVVGHILFSPVTVEIGSKKGLGLAPVAVLPSFQSQGIGSNLIKAGLEVAKDRGYDFVVLLGEPEYYQRFGFEKASSFGLDNEYGVDEPFMAIASRPEGLEGISGIVKYESEFGTFRA